MSPLRRWFREHGRPDWYSWVILIAMLITMSGLVWVSASVNQNSIERERMARETSERAFCGIVVLLDDAWHATPPRTESGKKLAVAVADARKVNHCPPRA